MAMGLIGLLYSKGTSMAIKDISYKFNRCVFDVENVSPVIDDKKERKGSYEFDECEFFSDGSLFTKKNLPAKGDISLRLNKCIVRSKEEDLSSDYMVVERCEFENSQSTIEK